MEELEEILARAKESQWEFMKALIGSLRSAYWESAHTDDPRSLYKALAYICAWVYLPAFPELASALPSHLETLRRQARADFTDLKPEVEQLFVEFCSGKYPSDFADIFTQPWTLALLLLSNAGLDSRLPVESLLPALLFTVTYLPSARAETAVRLSAALTRPNGVFTLIHSFATGENKEVMRDFAVRVLTSVPKSLGVLQYWDSVGLQCVSLLLECRCELYFRSILTEVVSRLLERYPDVCKREFLGRFAAGIRGEGLLLANAVQALADLARKSPPARLTLYVIETEFPVIYTLETTSEQFAATGLHRDAEEIVFSLCRHSEFASNLLFTAFITGFSLDFSYKLVDSSLEKTEISHLDTEPAVQNLPHNVSLLARIASDQLSAAVCSSLFSQLLSEYESSHSTAVLLYIAAIAETIPGEILVNSYKELVGFVRTAVGMTDSDREMRVLGLKLLVSVLETENGNVDRRFLLDISKKVVEMTQSDDLEIAEIAINANSLISSWILRKEIEGKTEESAEKAIPRDILKDLRSGKPFEKAYALHKISLFPYAALDTSAVFAEIQPLFRDSDTFLFQNLLKLVLRLSKVDLRLTLSSLFACYSSTSSDQIAKSHILELLFHIVISLGRVTIYSAAAALMEFLTTQRDTDDLLVSGKMSVMAELAKYLGPALHPYLGYMVGMALSCVKTATSDAFLHREIDVARIAAALIIIEKVMKNSPIDHVQGRIDEIRESLSLLCSFSIANAVISQRLTAAMDACEVTFARQYGLRPEK